MLGDRRAHSRCTSLHRLHALETRSPAALHTAAAPTPLERTAPRRRRLGLRLPARRSTRRSRSPRCGDAPGGRRARNHYYWIHPSGLRSSINACPSLPADRSTRRRCRALAPAISVQIPHARSAVELQPAAVQCVRTTNRCSAISRLPLIDSRRHSACRVSQCCPHPRRVVC